MPLLVVGLNYRSAPIDLLERASISQERLPEALHSLAGYEHVLECVVLSTCNRVEAYACVSALHGGSHDLRTFLAEFSDLAPEDLMDRLYTYRDGDAARHLFRVAAGIDSMLLGEAEILGQVRRSFRAAQGEETAGRALDPLFRRALHVGKRARTAASIQQDHVSTSSAVVEVARESFPRTALTGAGVAIVGAGDIGCSIAQAVRRAGVEDLVVVNRSEDRGRDLAHRYGATFRPMEELEAVAAAADLLVCATSARQPVVDRLLLERAMGRRGGRPLLVVDVGMPRNVDVNAHGVPGVSIRDLSDLKSLFDVETSTGVEDMSKIQEMVSRELDDYQDWLRESEVFPILSELIAQANATRESELERFLARTNDLSPQQLEAIEELSRRVVAKLLHSPLVGAKRLARRDHGTHEVLRELFGLGDDQPSACVNA